MSRQSIAPPGGLGSEGATGRPPCPSGEDPSTFEGESEDPSTFEAEDSSTFEAEDPPPFEGEGHVPVEGGRATGKLEGRAGDGERAGAILRTGDY